VILNEAKIITPGCWLNADINNDGIANFRDFTYLAANWQKAGRGLWGDLNQNNAVNLNDLGLFSDGWLETANWYKLIAEDINNSGIVNFGDFAVVRANWQIPGTALYGDLNNDWFIDCFDLAILAEHWLEGTLD
jgi:hypothetical protein